MDRKEKSFWRGIEVPIDDILNLKYSGKPKARLLNRLKKSPGWLQVLNNELGTNYKELKELVDHLYRYKATEFYRIYCLIEFKNLVDRNSIKNRTPADISKRYEKGLNEQAVSFDSLLYPIFRIDRNVLENIYYDFFLHKSLLKTYRCSPQVDIQEFLDGLDANKVIKFLNKLKDEKKIKYKFKLWWFEKTQDKIKILFRIESANSKAIYQVEENLFLKTAGPRLLILSEKGNRLDTLARFSDTISGWAGKIVGEAAQKDVTFSLVTQEFSTENVVQFLEKVRGEKIENMSIKAVSRRNAPVAGSPTIKVESEGIKSIDESLKDLENKHGLDLMKAMEDITDITISFKEKSYRIMMNTKDSKTKINFDSKYLTEEERDGLAEILNNEIAD